MKIEKKKISTELQTIIEPVVYKNNEKCDWEEKRSSES